MVNPLAKALMVAMTLAKMVAKRVVNPLAKTLTVAKMLAR